MPPYPWLLEATVDVADIRASVLALRKAGVPYSDADVDGVANSIAGQGQEIVTSLAGAGIQSEADREIVALIAYLQRLGREGRAYLSSQPSQSGGGR
jgi:cytochrome c oxidase cbb3-type subunit I/II